MSIYPKLTKQYMAELSNSSEQQKIEEQLKFKKLIKAF